MCCRLLFFFFSGGGGQVSFRGCEGGRGAGQLWGWGETVAVVVCFFLLGAGGKSASGVFCGEWKRVSFGLGVLSSAGNGGESASGGAKGEWRRVSFGVVCVALFFFKGESLPEGA